MQEQNTTQNPPSTTPHPTQYSQKYHSTINGFKQLQTEIDAKFLQLGDLRQYFFHKQEQKYVKTFTSIMEKLSSQLVQATKATETIDKEISSDPQCLFLQKELEYFQHHRDSTDKSIKEVKEQILKEYRRHREIQQERELLHNQLYRQTTREHKYNNKTKILTLRKETAKDSNTHSFLRPRTASVRHNSLQSHQMGHRNFSFSHKLSSGTVTQLTKVQTAMTQKSSRPYMSKSYRLP